MYWVSNDFARSGTPTFKPGARIDGMPHLVVGQFKQMLGGKWSKSFSAAGVASLGGEMRSFSNNVQAGGLALTPAGRNSFGKAISLWKG